MTATAVKYSQTHKIKYFHYQINATKVKLKLLTIQFNFNPIPYGAGVRTDFFIKGSFYMVIIREGSFYRQAFTVGGSSATATATAPKQTECSGHPVLGTQATQEQQLYTELPPTVYYFVLVQKSMQKLLLELVQMRGEESMSG